MFTIPDQQMIMRDFYVLPCANQINQFNVIGHRVNQISTKNKFEIWISNKQIKCNDIQNSAIIYNILFLYWAAVLSAALISNFNVLKI